MLDVANRPRAARAATDGSSPGTGGKAFFSDARTIRTAATPRASRRRLSRHHAVVETNNSVRQIEARSTGIDDGYVGNRCPAGQCGAPSAPSPE